MSRFKIGFTLIELLIAIALVAVLVGSGVAITFRASQRKQVEQAGRDFQGVLEQARANALAGKKVNCAAANQQLAGWGVSIAANGFTLDEYCGLVYGANPKLIVTTKTYSNTITFTAPTCPTLVPGPPRPCFPIIFKPSGQGIRPSNMAINFPASVIVTVTGYGFGKPIELYRSGQVSQNDLIAATPAPTSIPGPPTSTPAGPTSTIAAFPTSTPAVPNCGSQGGICRSSCLAGTNPITASGCPISKPICCR